MQEVQEMFHKADAFFQEENYEEAENIYKSILDISKDKYDSIKCCSQIAECYFHNNDFDKTVEYYDNSIKLEAIPDNILRLIDVCFIFKQFEASYKYIVLLIETVRDLEYKYNNASFMNYYEDAVICLRFLSDKFNFDKAKTYLKALNDF